MSKSSQERFAHVGAGGAVTWDAAIAHAKDKIREAEQRIARLKLSIQTFEEMRERGEPFPCEATEHCETKVS